MILKIGNVWNGDYGNYVKISHGIYPKHGLLETAYAHLNTIEATVDESIAEGNVVGEVGSTEYSTGPHLHFEIFKEGEPVNPEYFVSFG